MTPQGRQQPGLDLSQTTMSKPGGLVPPTSPHPGNLVTYAENYADNYPQRTLSVTNHSQISAPSTSDVGWDESVPGSSDPGDDRTGSRHSYTRVGASHGQQHSASTAHGIPETDEYRQESQGGYSNPLGVTPVLPPIASVTPIDFRDRGESRADSRHAEREMAQEQGQGQIPMMAEQGQLVTYDDERTLSHHENNYQNTSASQYDKDRIPHSSRLPRSPPESDVSSLHSRNTPLPEHQIGRMSGMGGYDRSHLTTTSPTIQQGIPVRSGSPAIVDQHQQGFRSLQLDKDREFAGQYQGGINQGGFYGQQQIVSGHSGYQSPAQNTTSKNSPVVEGQEFDKPIPEQRRSHQRMESISSLGTQQSITPQSKDNFQEDSPRARHSSMGSQLGQQFIQQQQQQQYSGGGIVTDRATVSTPQSQQSRASLPNSPSILQQPQGSHGQQTQLQTYPGPRATSPSSSAGGIFRGPAGSRSQSPAQEGGEKKSHPLTNTFTPPKEAKRGSGLLGVLRRKDKGENKLTMRDAGALVSNIVFPFTTSV